MKILTPIDVTDTVLVSSNVLENDHPVWVSGTTYPLDARVIYQKNIYTRILAGAGTVTPALDTANWKLVSATNKWKMFDKKGGSQTVRAGNITVSLTTPLVVNSISLLMLSASSVRVKMTAGGSVVFDETRNLTSVVRDMYEWFFLPVTRQETVLFTNLPQYANATIDIEINNTNGDAKVGSCLLGLLQQYGINVQYGASTGIQSYSIKQRDTFGNINIVSRSYNDRARFNLRIRPNETDGLKQKLVTLRDTPTLYIGSEEYQSLTVYGFFKDFDIVLSSAAYTDCSLEVEGLV